MIDTWRHGLATGWPWLLILGLILFALLGEVSRLRAVTRWFAPGVLERIGCRPSRRGFPLAVGLLAVFTLAMATQRWADAPTGTRWVMIDLSRSMAAADDAGRSRWQRARAVLEPSLTDRRPVAVIGFGRDATLLLPPSRDHDAIRAILAQLEPHLDRQGSDPAAALGLYDRLRDDGDSLVVVSDGEWPGAPRAPEGTVVGLGCGALAGEAVPRLPGDPPGELRSVPKPAALQALSHGRVAWADQSPPRALVGLELGRQQAASRWAIAALALMALEVAVVVAGRFRLSLTGLPYRWVQRYANWRLQRLAGLLLLIVLAGAVPAWEGRWQSRRSPALAAYNVGVAALKKGDRQAALQAWQEAVRLDADWQPAWYNLGTLLAADPGRHDAAVAALEKAVQLDPQDPWAAGNLAALSRQEAPSLPPTPLPPQAPSPAPTPAAPSAPTHGSRPGAKGQEDGVQSLLDRLGRQLGLTKRTESPDGHGSPPGRRHPGQSAPNASAGPGQHPDQAANKTDAGPGPHPGSRQPQAPAGRQPPGQLSGLPSGWPSGIPSGWARRELNKLMGQSGKQPAPGKTTQSRSPAPASKLPPLSPEQLDRLLQEAEKLTPGQLAKLARQQPPGQSQPMPPLTPEQMERIMALADRVPLALPDLQRQATTNEHRHEAPTTARPAGQAW